MTRGDTRQRILDVALRLFAERGYAGTSIRDIAEELDVTKAAVHYHFPSKEQLVQALLEPFVGRLSGLVNELEPGPVPAREVLLRWRAILDDGNPLLLAVSGDPSVAAACGALHADAKQMASRLARVMVGQDASHVRQLRAHACLGAFFAGYDRSLKLVGHVSDDDLEVVLAASLAALG